MTPPATATIRDALDRLVQEMVDGGILFEDACREFERRFIQYALERCEGSITRTSDRIGLHRNSLSRKLSAYRIRRSRG